MQTNFSEFDIERLRNQVNAKKEELMNALKADKEFAYIKPLYQELKELANKYNIVSGAAQCAGQQFHNKPAFQPFAHPPEETFTQF